MKHKDLLILQVRRLEAEPKDEHDTALAKHLRKELKGKYGLVLDVIDFNKAGSQDLWCDLREIHDLVEGGKKITEASRIVAKRAETGLSAKRLGNLYHSEYKEYLREMKEISEE